MHAAEFPLLSVGQFGLLDADMQRRANTGLNKGEAITRSRTRCGSDARAKSATAPAKDNIIAWLG